ncbi:MAG TPA: twin-arginine translocase subunit TatC [Bacteroidales bacterium]|nr:twin-arginine translocase subunit TatC [Bacteroidales bacterium]HQB56000.1 twin-arginine translocase subunit TatC [Bacteroidales bacterium]
MADTLRNKDEMTFWEHLDEFRKVVFRSAILLILLMVIVFVNKNFVFDTIIFAPRSSDFILYKWMGSLAALIGVPSLGPKPFMLELQNIELAAQFFTHISVSFSIAFVISTPFILYQLWIFIKPALYPKEKKSVTNAFAWCSLLFFLGVLTGYFFVFPLTINFLGSYQVSEFVENQITLQSYIHMFTWLVIIMGVVFEMPILLRLLSRLGVISKELLKKYRKHAACILLILAAIITPSGDAFTLFIVALPLYLLYEVSIMVSYSKRAEEDEKVAA